LDMIFATALALGLIQLTQQSGQKPRYLAGSNLDDWMKLEPSQQVRLFLDLWWKPTNNFWIDVAGANYQPEGFGYYMDIRAARKGILDYLKQECEPGTWYVLEAFLQNAKAHDPLLLRSQSPYASYSGLRNRKDILARWDLTDGQIITGILASTLHELGLVTIGFRPAASINEEAGNPYAFQLTSLAKEVLWPDVQGVTGRSDKPEHPLIVQPNFELLLLQPDYIALYQILPFARVEQVEMVSRLLLTQDSVRHGIEAGWNIDRILQTLRSLSSKELPQNVLYTLQDWGRLFKDASISQILLIEVGNETVADDLCSSTKFRSLGLRRLGPCAVAVSNQASFQTLRNTLEKEGIIVRVQGDILSARDNASTSYGRRR
ncbi:MAG TPA: helicase-associated domain-containing protein, partial [Ktedonobacteraceae bacterium]|nr:helicase-associated domain-containing protein [Ktedonobacteraceae bacterium]